MGISLTDEKKGYIFTMCGDKTLAEVGFEFGLDKNYKTVATMKSAVARIYNQVKNDPDKYFINQNTYNKVLDAVEERKTAGLTPFKSNKPEDVVEEPITIREKREIINPDDIKGLILGGRNKAAKLIYEKLDRIGKSKKLLDNVSLGEMAKVVGILVDKGQILQGQSTENIAVLSKNIDSNLTPEEAIEAVLKMREMQQAKN